MALSRLGAVSWSGVGLVMRVKLASPGRAAAGPDQAGPQADLVDAAQPTGGRDRPNCLQLLFFRANQLLTLVRP
jgi:hypothetical protein